MVEHRSHSAVLEYDASAGWKLRKLGRDIRRRRRHLRLVNDRAVSRHDANLRFRHRHVQPGKILHVGSPLPMTKPILSASAEEPRPLPDVEKLPFGDARFSGRPTSAAFKKSAGGPANLSIGQGAAFSTGLSWCCAAMFHLIAVWRVFVTLDFSTFSTKSA